MYAFIFCALVGADLPPIPWEQVPRVVADSVRRLDEHDRILAADRSNRDVLDRLDKLLSLMERQQGDAKTNSANASTKLVDANACPSGRCARCECGGGKGNRCGCSNDVPHLFTRADCPPCDAEKEWLKDRVAYRELPAPPGMPTPTLQWCDSAGNPVTVEGFNPSELSRVLIRPAMQSAFSAPRQVLRTRTVMQQVCPGRGRPCYSVPVQVSEWVQVE